jgi:hypothetical protein
VDRIGHNAYWRTAGEVEARNVTHRMNMTPEERRASLAAETEDVMREDQIFIHDSLGASSEDGVRFQVEENEESGDTESTPPVREEGESISDYSNRVSEWWKEKSKEINSVTKELNKAHTDVAGLRAKRDKLVAKHSERVEKILENAHEVKKYIQEHLSGDMIAWMGEREFGSPQGKIENATRRKDLEPVFRAIDRTINTIEYRKYHTILKNLLNKKITGKDKRGISVAKSIGGTTKEVVEYIRAYIQENRGKGEEEIEARIKDIYNEHIKSNANNTDEAEMTREQILELQSLVRDHSLIRMLQDNMAEIDNEIKNIYSQSLKSLPMPQ